MPEHHASIITNLDVIGIGIQRNRHAILHVQSCLVGIELAPVDHHPLTPCANRSDPTVQRLRDKAIADMKRQAIWGQHDPTGFPVALKLNVVQHELA